MVNACAWGALLSTAGYLLLLLRDHARNAPARLAVAAVGPPERDDPTTPDAAADRAFALVWRAQWVAVALRSTLLLILGLTPLGSWLVRSIAPTGEAVPSAIACVVVLLIVASPRLVALRWRSQAVALSPELRPDISRRLVLRTYLGQVAGVGLVVWVFTTDTDTFVLGCVGALAGMALRPLLVDRITVRKRKPSPLFTSTMATLPFPTPSWLRIVEGSTAGAGSRAGGWAVSDSPKSPVHVVITPGTVELLGAGELTALIAHEVAHIERRDVTHGAWRSAAFSAAIITAALGSSALPPLRLLSNAPQQLGPPTLPLMLAAGYAAMRALTAVALVVSRQGESACDLTALALCQDRDAAVQMVTKPSELRGLPGRWTRAQHLLMATHPSTEERAGLLTHTPMPEVAPQN